MQLTARPLARPLAGLRRLPACRLARRLARDRGGLALLEFAFSLPLVLGIGLYGVETANLALANLRISQIALNLADNASRVGLMGSLASVQLREVDMNDVLNAARKQGTAWQLTTRGRITVSSLEGDGNGNQVIHWQRCLGLKAGTNYDSSYGRTRINGSTPAAANSSSPYDPTAGVNTASGSSDNASSHPGSATSGMGDTGAQVTAPTNSGVMFVEINYDYLPVVSTAWLPGGAARIHYIASFIVRDRRDFTEIYNPSPAAAAATCDKYAS